MSFKLSLAGHGEIMAVTHTNPVILGRRGSAQPCGTTDRGSSHSLQLCRGALRVNQHEELVPNQPCRAVLHLVHDVSVAMGVSLGRFAVALPLIA